MRRVQRDATKEDLIQQLCDAKTGHFSEIWRLLLFAALLGKSKGRREPLKSISSSTIREEVFRNCPIWPGIVHLLGLSEDGDPSRLKSEYWDVSLTVFEEYANGGLSLLSEKSLETDLASFSTELRELVSGDVARRENVRGIRI